VCRLLVLVRDLYRRRLCDQLHVVSRRLLPVQLAVLWQLPLWHGRERDPAQLSRLHQQLHDVCSHDRYLLVVLLACLPLQLDLRGVLSSGLVRQQLQLPLLRQLLRDVLGIVHELRVVPGQQVPLQQCLLPGLPDEHVRQHEHHLRSLCESLRHLLWLVQDLHILHAWHVLAPDGPVVCLVVPGGDFFADRLDDLPGLRVSLRQLHALGQQLHVLHLGLQLYVRRRRGLLPVQLRHDRVFDAKQHVCPLRRALPVLLGDQLDVQLVHQRDSVLRQRVLCRVPPWIG